VVQPGNLIHASDTRSAAAAAVAASHQQDTTGTTTNKYSGKTNAWVRFNAYVLSLFVLDRCSHSFTRVNRGSLIYDTVMQHGCSATRNIDII
jgi:hypothetical protein